MKVSARDSIVLKVGHGPICGTTRVLILVLVLVWNQSILRVKKN